MSLGCRHDPENCCEECLLAFKDSNAVFIDTNLKPESGETLQQFQKRVGAEKTIAATSGEIAPPTQYVEPSIEEQKRIMKDPTVPEPVRLFWREKRYGKGGSGRKGVQQERLQRQNIVEGQRVNAPSAIPKTISARQQKRARRLLRKMAKAAGSAE